MNLLITDPHNLALTGLLIDAVQAAGLTVEPIDLGADPNVIERYRLGRVPCVARIHAGLAVYLTDVPVSVATFEADADAAIKDYETAKAERLP